MSHDKSLLKYTKEAAHRPGIPLFAPLARIELGGWKTGGGGEVFRDVLEVVV